MAITFIGSHVGTHASTSAQTVNFSSLRDGSGGTPTLQQNDIVYVSVENSTATVNRGAGALVPSGYTAAHAARYDTDSNASNFQVSYKVMGATPDTSVAIPASNATTSGVAYSIYVFRGINTTSPHDVTVVTTGGGNTGIANAAAITPVSSGAWIVAFAGAAVAAGAVFTNPAGMSTTTNHFRTATITTTTNDANIGTALYTAWASGVYDPAAFGGSTSTNTGSWSAVTIALKPFVPTNYPLTCNSGSYSVTGSSVTVSKDRYLVTSSGSYSLTGSSVTITKGSALNNYLLSCTSGSYTLTGNNLSVNKQRSLTSNAGSFTITGSTATITYTHVANNYSLIANSGNYNVTGNSLISGVNKSLYPDESNVKAGVVYGPGGIYTGTLMGGGSGLIRRR